MRHPPRLVEAVQHHLPELAHVDDSRHALAQRGEGLHELEPLGEEDRQHLLFDLRLERLEEDEDHERGDHGVEEEQPGRRAAGPPHQEAVDQRQHHSDAGEHHDLSQQLVQVQQAVSQDGLGEEVEIDGHRHVREGRRRPSREADEQLPKGESHAEGGPDPEIEQARALGPRGGASHPGVEQAHRRGELDEDGPRGRDARRRHERQGRDGHRHGRQRRGGGEPSEAHDAASRFPLKFNDESKNGHRDEPGCAQGQPQRPGRRRSEDSVEEVANLVCEQRHVEQRKCHPESRPPLAEQHCERQRQADDGGEKRALGPGIHPFGG